MNDRQHPGEGWVMSGVIPNDDKNPGRTLKRHTRLILAQHKNYSWFTGADEFEFILKHATAYCSVLTPSTERRQIYAFLPPAQRMEFRLRFDE